MSPLLKTALAWILALALPMQGLAAATMLHCALEPTSAAVPEANAHTGHHGAASADSAVVQDAAAPHAAHHAGDAADHVGHQCSACAACVAGAVLPSAAPKVTPLDAGGTPLLAAAAHERSIVLAGLERPPRPDRA